MSTIVVTKNGVDITNKIEFASMSFESQMGAVPGEIEFDVKDVDQTFTAATGDEIVITLDGVTIFGGYLLQAGKKHHFPADDTVTILPADNPNRLWSLRGVDYNILFDKRILRIPSDYLKIPDPIGPAPMDDASALNNMVTNLFDLSDIAGVDATAVYTYDASTGSPDGYQPLQQGTTLRATMDALAVWGGLYYFRPTKVLFFGPQETQEAVWGFSDTPDNGPIPDDYATQPLWGARDIEVTEDGSLIINDAFVWGGSEFAGNGTTVVGHVDNSTSISDHGRWQYAETHFGEVNFKNQAGVDARANVIVTDNVAGTDPGGTTRGFVRPQYSVKLTWFDRNVPVDPNTGFRAHLVAGMLVPFEFSTLGISLVLPMRSIRVTFPGQSETGEPIPQFDGTASLQLSDSNWLWQYLLRKHPVTEIISSGTGAGGSSLPYGSKVFLTPTPDPDSSTTVFTLPISYIAGTTEVYIDDGTGGVRLFAPDDYTESDPEAGELTFTTAPATGTTLVIGARSA